MVRYGDWGDDKDKIDLMVKRLTVLFEKIRLTRNKILAHSDLEASIGTEIMGAFPDGLDVEYFSVLQELVDEISRKWSDGPFPFCNSAELDVEQFLDKLEKA